MTRYSYAVSRPYGHQAYNSNGGQANVLRRWRTASLRDAWVADDEEHREAVSATFAQRIAARTLRFATYPNNDPWMGEHLFGSIAFMDRR